MLLGVAPAAGAPAPNGGATYTPQPRVKRLTCLRVCATSGRIRDGSLVRVSGAHLAAVRKLVFQGASGVRDDAAARVRPRADNALTVRVPVNANSGPVMAWTGGRVHSRPSAPVAILPPPPPAWNPKLSPAPGAPGIETATSRTRWFLGSEHGIAFSYRLRAGAPSVDVQLVRVADGAVVQTWHAASVAAGAVQTLSWNGVVAGKPQRVGRYAFRLVAQEPSGTVARNAGDGDVQRDAFNLYDHIFPIRGRHDYGSAGNRFGAPRSGHTHQGQDVLAACGTRLVAARGGLVRYVQYQSAAGYYLVIRGDDGVDYAYMHMAGPAPFQSGDRVYTGERIGLVGRTGDATACHLHIEMWSAPGWWSGGHPFDPLPYLQAWDRIS